MPLLVPMALNRPRTAVVLLGASGFLGRNLMWDWQGAGPDVLGVSRRPQDTAGVPAQPGLGWRSTEDWTGAADALARAGRRVVVLHLQALADHRACTQNPEEARRANCGTAVAGASWCRERGIPFVTVGTDGLFAGSVPGGPAYWTRDVPPDPADVYGRTKREAELALEALGWGHVLRLSFVGHDRGTGRGLLAFLARSLGAPEPKVQGWTDNWFTPLPTPVLARWLASFLEEAAGGHSIRHWGSHPALSKFDFLEQVALEAGYRPVMVSARKADGPGGPLDQSLACDQVCTREELIRLSAQALSELLA